MKHAFAISFLLAPLCVSCLGGGYAPPGSFSYKQPFPVMGPNGEAAPAEAAPTASAAQATPGQPTGGVQNASPARPLVGWDGGVVAPAKGGSITPADPMHGIGPSDKGRMHILELYQGVIDERDALADEVAALRNQLAYAEAHVAEANGREAAYEGQIGTLQAEKRALAAEIDDLLGRLTTAQIRRLEAEKLVLETKLTEFADRTAKRDESGAGSLSNGSDR